MKLFIFLLVLFSCLDLSPNNVVQESATAPARTPEQEAAIQTQKMQAELNLNNEQSQAIYEINLKHARERQVSNSRSQALERVKNKDNEVQQVLTRDQYNRLQDKRYERYPSGSTPINRISPQQRTQTVPQRTTPSNQRSTRTVVPQRTTPTNRNETTPRTASPSERINIYQNSRGIPVNPSVRSTTPQPRSTPSQEQNRTTRTPTTTPSNNDRTQRR